MEKVIVLLIYFIYNFVSHNIPSDILVGAYNALYLGHNEKKKTFSVMSDAYIFIDEHSTNE